MAARLIRLPLHTSVGSVSKISKINSFIAAHSSNVTHCLLLNNWNSNRYMPLLKQVSKRTSDVKLSCRVTDPRRDQMS